MYPHTRALPPYEEVGRIDTSVSKQTNNKSNKMPRKQHANQPNGWKKRGQDKESRQEMTVEVQVKRNIPGRSMPIN
jgi:hypothetical protein